MILRKSRILEEHQVFDNDIDKVCESNVVIHHLLLAFLPLLLLLAQLIFLGEAMWHRIVQQECTITELRYCGSIEVFLVFLVGQLNVEASFIDIKASLNLGRYCQSRSVHDFNHLFLLGLLFGVEFILEIRYCRQMSDAFLDFIIHFFEQRILKGFDKEIDQPLEP